VGDIHALALIFVRKHLLFRRGRAYILGRLGHGKLAGLVCWRQPGRWLSPGNRLYWPRQGIVAQTNISSGLYGAYTKRGRKHMLLLSSISCAPAHLCHKSFSFFSIPLLCSCSSAYCALLSLFRCCARTFSSRLPCIASSPPALSRCGEPPSHAGRRGAVTWNRRTTLLSISPYAFSISL